MKLSDTEIKRNSKEKLGFNQGSGGNDNTNVRNFKATIAAAAAAVAATVVAGGGQ
jgi:hypothetical protein